MRFVHRAFVALFSFGLVACSGGGGSEGSGAATGEERGVTVVQADVRYPFSSMEEKRTFTDAWVAGTVTDETIAPFDGPEPSEGTQARRVDVRVDRVHWRRPGVDVPGEISSEAPLIVTDGRVSYLVAEGGAALEVGGSYLLGVVREPDGRFTIAAPAAVVPIDADRVSPTIGDDGERSEPVAVATYVKKIVAATPVVADDVGDVAARLEVWEAKIAASSEAEAGG